MLDVCWLCVLWMDGCVCGLMDGWMDVYVSWYHVQCGLFCACCLLEFGIWNIDELMDIVAVDLDQA